MSGPDFILKSYQPLPVSSYLTCPFLFPIVRWSYGVVLWELFTYGKCTKCFVLWLPMSHIIPCSLVWLSVILSPALPSSLSNFYSHAPGSSNFLSSHLPPPFLPPSGHTPYPDIQLGPSYEPFIAYLKEGHRMTQPESSPPSL